MIKENKKGTEMKQKINTRSIFMVAFVTMITLVMSGCAASIRSEGISNDIDNRSTRLLERQNEQVVVENTASFSSDSSSFFSQKPLNVISGDEQQELPPVLKKDVMINVPQQTKLRDILAKITQLTGVFFSINADVFDVASNEGSGFGANDSAFSGDDAQPQNPPALPAGAGGAGSGSQSVNIDSLVYNGQLASMLDVIAGKLNINWKWVGNKVEFYALDTVTYNVVALPGTTDTTATITATSTTGSSTGGEAESGAGSTGNSGNTTSLTTSSDVWAELQETLDNVVSENGNVNYIPSAGKVTVTDTPNKLRVAQRIIDDFNETFSKQVIVNVEVLSVALNESDDYGASLDAIVNQLDGRFNVSYGAQGPQNGNILSIILNDSDSRYDGSQAIISALSTIGDTSMVTNASLMTLNGQPVPLQVTREVAYAASTSTSLNENTSQTEIEPGIVQEGFTINMTPRITNSKQVLLQYSLDLSEIVEIQTFGPPESQIQLPTRNVRNFLQRSSLRSGETLMLAGFKQLSSSQDKQGTLSPRFWPFGGSKNVENANTQLVVLITPYVVE